MTSTLDLLPSFQIMIFSYTNYFTNLATSLQCNLDFWDIG
jgi:hypothetical protein